MPSNRRRRCLGDRWREDRLIHVDRGASLRSLPFTGRSASDSAIWRSNHVEYRVERLEHSLTALLRSNLSFFVNESLAMKKGTKF